ncbi:MAG: IS30 family transposase [Permianibacter sp.]
MIYTHLTEDERYQIKEYLDDGLIQAEIARRLMRDRGTISRELQRNRGERGYRPAQAQRMAKERQQNNHGLARIDAELWQHVERQLQQDHSPEQVCESRRAAGLPAPSHERIYQHIYQDKARGGTLHRHLRCQKAKRKRYGSGRERRGQIRNRRSIAERPVIVERREHVGDWEGDTVLGKQESQAVVTLVERKSRYLVARKVPRRKAEPVRNAIVSGLAGFDELVQTITFDNGKEFALHDEVAVALFADTFFADAFASWQRGANENTNGLLRQYIPKSESLDELSDAALQSYVDKLNDRPRKCLGWKTPRQVMLEAAASKGVALPI